MELGNTTLMTEEDMKVNGVMMKEKVREFSSMQMEINSKVD